MANTVSPQEQAIRREVVGGSVTAEEKAHIDRARQRAGYRRMSHCVREVMLRWAETVDPEQSAA